MPANNRERKKIPEVPPKNGQTHTSIGSGPTRWASGSAFRRVSGLQLQGPSLSPRGGKIEVSFYALSSQFLPRIQLIAVLSATHSSQHVRECGEGVKVGVARGQVS